MTIWKRIRFLATGSNSLSRRFNFRRPWTAFLFDVLTISKFYISCIISETFHPKWRKLLVKEMGAVFGQGIKQAQVSILNDSCKEQITRLCTARNMFEYYDVPCIQKSSKRFQFVGLHLTNKTFWVTWNKIPEHTFQVPPSVRSFITFQNLKGKKCFRNERTGRRSVLVLNNIKLSTL